MDEPPCQYRSAEPLGTVYCGCVQVVRPVYWCDHSAISNYVTLHAGRVKKHRVKLTEGGEDALTTLTPPVCAVCPYRPDASPELKAMMQVAPDTQATGPPRSEAMQATIVSICSNCPRFSETCGPTLSVCPQSLWPTGKRFKGVPGKKGGCCG